MIKKIPDQIPVQTGEWGGTTFDIIPKETFGMACRKINELVDTINTIQKEREAERFEIQEWIGLLEAVRKSVNIHEKQIDELQMKLEPEKCEPAENTQDENPRCPFCGEELFYVQEIDGGFDILTCNCSAGFWLFGNDKMWYNLEKTTKELERTKKQLEAAKTLITEIKTVIAEQDLEPQELEQKE